MPRPKSHLPPLPSAFSVRDALAAGVSKGALRHAGFTKPFHGVRAIITEAPATATAGERALRTAKLLLPRLRPGEAISHSSALLLHGCPIHVASDLHITSQPGHAPSRARGVVGHRAGSPALQTRVDGVPVVTPPIALMQSAGQLPLRELVVAADHLICPRGISKRFLLADRDMLMRSTAPFCGRGSRELRLALSLSRPGAESRMETLTRLLLVAYGLASSFTLQSAVSDEAGWIGRFDLVDHIRKLIVEFDGEQHRTDRAQYAKDLRRLDRARAAGYLVIRLLSGDVVHRPHETASRIAAALGQELKPHPLRDSLLTLTQ